MSNHAPICVNTFPNGDRNRRTGPVVVEEPHPHEAPSVMIEVRVGQGKSAAALDIEIDTWNGLPRIKSVSTKDMR